MKGKLFATTSGTEFNLIVGGVSENDLLSHSPDMRVLKTGQGVVEYLRLENSLPTEQILSIAKSVLLLSEKKINALYS